MPTVVLLAGLGYALAEAADLYLSANRPSREVAVIDGADAPPDAASPDPVPNTLRRTLPLTMAAWGLAVVVGYEGLRRLVKGPPAKPAKAPTVPATYDVDKLLEDLMRKAEADRAITEATTPMPGGVTTPIPADGSGK